MASLAPHSLVFRVRRKEPELVAPAKPTPRELKPLSNLDDHELLHFHISGLMMYRSNPSMEGKDPVKVIREAIAQALVFYYPYAGRLREGPGRNLSVDCTGEGVLFIEADADVALEDFGAMLYPPFPCVEELLFDIPGSDGVLHCPLLLVQVTRLKCGGFIFAVRYNHTMSDAPGLGQFLSIIGEMARGTLSPLTPPCWKREFFRARDPPRMTYPYLTIGIEDMIFTPFENMVEKSFFFGYSHLSALRRLAPHNLRQCSTFDLLTACLWRCRTLALKFHPTDNVYIMFTVNARAVKFNPPLPLGYYGNASTLMVVATTADKLYKTVSSSFGHALELVMKAKADGSEEYMRSVVDAIEVKGFCPLPGMRGGRCFMVSDVRHSRLNDVDFGWGKGAYGGIAMSPPALPKGFLTFYTPCKNIAGKVEVEDGVVVQMSFPPTTMEIFEHELHTMFNHKPFSTKDPLFIKSGL